MTTKEKAEKLKYIKNNFETTLTLTKLLQEIYQDNYLSQILVLKGGSAVQLYLEKFSRLFFDLDIDFKSDIKERKQFQRYLLKFMEQIGYKNTSSKSRYSYSLDSYKFPYYLENGNINYLKLDINYSLGNHLYPIIKKQINNEDFLLHQNIFMVHFDEILGMKIAAFQDRGRIKDLYDIYQMINSNLQLNMKNVQNAYLFYMVIASCAKKIETLDNIDKINQRDIKKLYPVIQKESHLNINIIKKKVLSYIKECCILNKRQIKFIKLFEEAQYHPEYLFDDKIIIQNAIENPIANWKMKLKKTHK